MLRRERRPSGRRFPGNACTGPIGLLIVFVSHLFSTNISPLLSSIACSFTSCACCCRLPRRAPHLAPRGSPIHAALHPVPRCVPSPVAPATDRCAQRPRCCAPRPVPQTQGRIQHRGGVGSRVAFPRCGVSLSAWWRRAAPDARYGGAYTSGGVSRDGAARALCAAKGTQQPRGRNPMATVHPNVCAL
jgi:hypothetical protein